MPKPPSDRSKTPRGPDGPGGDGASSDSRLLDFARASADWFWETDADDRFTYVSDQVFEAAGIKPEHCIGASRRDLQTGIQQDAVWNEYARIVAAREPFRDFTFTSSAPDGSTYPISISGVPVFEGDRFMGYRGMGRRVSQGELIERLVRNIVDATARSVGIEFLRQLAAAMCREMGFDSVLVGGVSPDGSFMETRAAFIDGEFQDGFRYRLDGSPCAEVVRGNVMCLYPQGVADAFPDDPHLAENGIEGYLGIPLIDANGGCQGLIVAMRRSALALDDSCKSVLEFFAGRVSAEIDRVRSEETMRGNEALLSAIVDNLPHGVTVKTPDGRYKLINKEFSRRYGVPQTEELGWSNEERFPEWEASWAASRAQEKDVAESGENTVREQDRVYADGTEHRLEITKFPITGRDGDLLAVGALGVDITERTTWEREARERERVLKNYHAALDRIVASEAMASPNAGDAFALLTQVAAKTLGVERVSVWRACPEMTCLDCLDMFTLSQGSHDRGLILERDAFPQYFKTLQQTEVIDAHDAANDPRTFEFAEAYLGKHGISSLLDTSVHIGGELKGVLCLEHVGPARRWTLEEQSLARSLAALTSLIMVREEQLDAERERQSIERRFSDVVNALPSSLSLKDRDRRYVFVNKIYEKNYGVSADEAHGKTIAELDLNNDEILASIEEEDLAVLAEGRSITREAVRIARDGTVRAALVSKFPVYDDAGEVELVGTLWTDISDQKANQKILEDARARLRAITDNVPIILSLKGLDGKYMEGNAGFAKWHGLRVQEVPGKTSRDVLNPGRAEIVEALDQRVIETGEVVVEEAVSELQLRPDGNPTIFRMIKFPVHDGEGKVMAVGTAMTDITEQKVAQRSLEEARARLLAITENVPIMLALKDLDGHLQAANPAFAAWHGMDAEGFAGLTAKDYTLPARADEIAEVEREVVETGEVITHELTSRRNFDAAGRPLILQVIKFPVRDAAGRVSGVGTAMTDITDQKRALQSLEETQARLFAITDNVPIMLSLKDTDGVFQYCNTEFADWHGIKAEEISGKQSSDIILPERAEAVVAEDRKVLETGDVLVFETESVLHKDRNGYPATIRQFKFPVRDNAGTVTGVGTAILDISDERRAERALQAHLEKLEDMIADRTVELTQEVAERKRAEDELRRSEANLRAVLERSPVGVAIVARSPRRRLFVNQSFLDAFGAASLEEIDAVPMVDTYVDPADLDRLARYFDENGGADAVEVRRKRLDGTPFWLLMHSRVVEFEGEKAALVWHYDITKRKEIEETLARQAEILEQTVAERTRELRESESLVNSIIEHLPAGIMIKNADSKLERANSIYTQWYGVPSGDLNALRQALDDSARTPGDKEIRMRHETEVISEGEIRSREVERMFADGRIHTVSVSNFPIFGQDGKVVRVGAVSMDVTEEVEARKALQRHERLLLSLIDNLPVGITMTDPDERYNLVNQTFCDWYGLERGDVVGNDIGGLAGIMKTDPAEIQNQEDLARTEGMMRSREVERPHADGRVHNLLITKYPFKDEIGKTVGVVSVSVDLTDLRARERQLSTLVENVPGMVFRHKETRDGNIEILFLSEGVDDIIGLPADVVRARVNAGDMRLTSPEDWDGYRAESIRCFQAGVPLEYTFRMVRPDGGTRWVVERSRAVQTLDDGWIVEGLVLDVTEQKLADDALRQNQAWLRAFTDNLPIYLNLKDEDGRYLFVNKHFADVWNTTADRLVGRLRVDVFDKAPSEVLSAHDREILKTREVHDFEFEARSPALQGRMLRIIKFPVTDDDGVVLGVGSASLDITDQKRAENEIRQSQAWLRAFTDNLPIYLNLKDPEGTYLFVNKLFAASRNKTPEHFIGKTVAQAFDREPAKDLAEYDRGVLASGDTVEFEAPGISAELLGRILHYIKFPVTDPNGNIIGIGTAAMDVTDEKNAEIAIRESEAKLQAITQNAPMLLNLKDLDGRYQFANDSYSQWVNKPMSEILGKKTEELFPARDAEEIIHQEIRVIQTGEPVEFEMEALAEHADGERMLQYIKFPVRNAENDIFGIGTAILDITDRVRADTALKESESRFRGLFENAPAGIAIKTTTGRYLAMNKTFLDWKGWDLLDVVGRRAADLFGEEEGRISDEDDARLIADRTPIMKEVMIDCADGRTLTTTNIKAPMLTPDGDVTGVCSFYVDVSEIREIEAQLQQAQKMEAVGRLAGGIAHDFNNLLGAMMGFNEFLIEDLEKGTPQHNFAQRVAKAGERAKQLVSQILAFSRASHGEQSVIDMNAIAEEAATLLSGTLPVTSRVVFNPTDAEATAMTNAGQMSQVLMNLGVNANDAFSGEDGMITMTVQRVAAGADLLRVHDGPVKTTPEDFMEIREIENDAWQLIAGGIDPEKDHVRISVKDTGPGIPEKVLRRVFDPFFTTKEAGKGTGLGLAVVHGIVTAHHGAIRVTTRLGKGTQFEIFLPCASTQSEIAAGEEVAEKIDGHGMILIVDDERDVADMVSIGLERLGYEVGVCADGTEALEVFRETPDLWRAVISDQIMPDMRGIELIGQIKEIRPDIPCILCTGYSDTLTEETALNGGADAFFQKPVSFARLGRALADFLAK
ncbi:MAG: hypothetical protein CMM61_11485 [Rhodospirillaceae bacterium]|nr:hypothetical protein [Rhodospirillaceae bacterium]